MSESHFIGVDLGGTQLRMAAVTASGRLATDIFSVPTGRQYSPEDLRRDLGALDERVRASLGPSQVQDLKALGLGTPGVIVSHEITQSDNLPLLNGVNLGQLVREVAVYHVAVENDANCFALAEARFGAGRGAAHLCGVTLGTGIGCGVIINGQIHRGAFSQAGEVYKIPLREGQLEYYVSGAGLVRNYLAAGGRLDRLRHGHDGAGVAELARGGDDAARASWRTFSGDLYFVSMCIIALVDPEVIMIGGSLAEARDLFAADLLDRLAGHPTRLAFAELGPAAGLIGAAALNLE
jgi:predicted NBD/HSP70 family sugar kinase